MTVHRGAHAYLLPTGVHEVDAVLQAAGHLEDMLLGRLHADADSSLHHGQLQRRGGDFGLRRDVGVSVVSLFFLFFYIG